MQKTPVDNSKTYQIRDFLIHPRVYTLLIKDVWNTIYHNVGGIQLKTTLDDPDLYIDSIALYDVINGRYSGLLNIDKKALLEVLDTLSFSSSNGMTAEFHTAQATFNSYNHHFSESPNTPSLMLYDYIMLLLSDRPDAEKKEELKSEKPETVVPRSEVLIRPATKVINRRSPIMTSDEYKTSENPNGSGVLMFNISDMHFFNKVQSRDVMNLNQYDENIARRRWAQFIEGAKNTIKLYNPKYIVLAMLGDFYSGRVHNNADKDMDDSTMTEVIIKGELMINEMIHELAKHAFIKTIHICPGNHSRINPKDFDTTTFLRDNDDYATGCRIKEKLSYTLPKTLVNNPGSLTIPDCIEGVGYIFSHGHAIRGGTGMSSMPISSAVTTANKWAANWQSALSRHRQGEIDITEFNPAIVDNHDFFFKYAMVGHFHTQMRIPGTSIAIIGGLSLLGTCKFANNVLGYNSPAGVSYYMLDHTGITLEGAILVK